METRQTIRNTSPGMMPEGSFVETENAATNSIEVTRNAKGDYQWSIKVYWRPDELFADVEANIARIDTLLRDHYLFTAFGSGLKGE